MNSDGTLQGSQLLKRRARKGYMWADNETTLDLLGFKVHADLVRSVVTDTILLPTTIGVFGDWGGGKTSVMKMLERDLDPEAYGEQSEKERYEKVACLYFNGWLFEGYDDAKSAILSSILLQLGAHKRFGPKVRDKAFSLLQSVSWMRLARLGFKEVALPAAMAYLTGGASLLPSLAGPLKKLVGAGDAAKSDGDTTATTKTVNVDEFFKPSGQPAGPMDVRTFRDQFSQMLEESDVETLVVLIDDLDRCSPQRIIDNLEAIKLFLSVDRTAFVIGADPRIVRHAIRTVYDPAEAHAEDGELEPQTDIVSDYLEKVIQVPYHLPRLSPSEVETYMSLLFCRRDLNDEKAFKELQAASERHRQNDRYAVFGYEAIQEELGASFTDQLAANLSFCRTAAPLITEGLKGNPRQVKRFLNAFVLRKKLAGIAKLDDVRDDVLVKLMILEYTRPPRFNQLYQWQAAQHGHPQELKALEQSLRESSSGDAAAEQDAKAVDTNWGTSFLRKWVAMDPQLSDVDLRDYFWVARDRLQSTLSESSMVPRFIRVLVEDLLSDNPSRQEKAVLSAKEASADELDVLIDILKRRVQRDPDAQRGYDALRELALQDLPGGADALAQVMGTVPAARIPAALGPDILAMLDQKEEIRISFEPVLERLRKTDTRIAAALRPRRMRNNGRGNV